MDGATSRCGPRGGAPCRLLFSVDHDRREVTEVAIGPVTSVDALQHLEHEVRHEGSGYAKFVDLRGAGVLVTREENIENADRTRAYSREVRLGPIAFVVSSEAAQEEGRHWLSWWKPAARCAFFLASARREPG